MRLLFVVLVALAVSGCAEDGMLMLADNDQVECKNEDKAEHMSCLTREYRHICSKGLFRLRANRLEQKSVSDGDIGVRLCKNKVAVTVGPQIDGQDITGSLAKQAQDKTTACYHLVDEQRTICDARVKLAFLRDQFKVLCLAGKKPTIRPMTEDLMGEIVIARNDIVDTAQIRGFNIFKPEVKWICRRHKTLLGMNQPVLKQIFQQPENKLMTVALNEAKSSCGKKRNDANCFLPKVIDSLGGNFRKTCLSKSVPIKRNKHLKYVLHARNLLVAYHPVELKKHNFTWLCGNGRVFLGGMKLAGKLQKMSKHRKR